MTLTETAKTTKRFLKIGLTLGSTVIVLWLIFLFVYNNFYIPYKKSQIKPEQKFGTLQQPKFPTSVASSSTFEYNLDTQYGGLPNNIPKLINVYFIPPQETTLLAPERTRKLATTLNFTSDPQILSPSEYRYTDDWGGLLTTELSTGNFSFKRVIPTTINNQPLQQNPTLPNENDIITSFNLYLSLKGLLLSNFTKPRSVISYNNPDHQLATTAKISLWPDNIGDFPIVTDSPVNGPITATMTKYQDDNFKISEMNYTIWSFDSKRLSSYATQSVSQVFQDLKAGKGIVIKNPTKTGKVSITKVYIAYYLPSQYQPYLEPIYVFEGADFVAYLPALTPDSYSTK